MKILWQRQLNPPRQGGSSDPFWNGYDLKMKELIDKGVLSDVVDEIEIPIRLKVFENIVEGVRDEIRKRIYS